MLNNLLRKLGSRHILVLLVLISLILSCSSPVSFPNPQLPTEPLPVESGAGTSGTSSQLPPTLTPGDSAATEFPPATITPATLPSFACTYRPAVEEIFTHTSSQEWLDWIEKLSGAQPVEINGTQVLIETRYSPVLFSGQPNARAFDWLLEQVSAWYPAEQVEVQPFTVTFENQAFTWKNLILTLPGQTNPEEIVILSAHLDSTSEDPRTHAPGAEDNGSGSAALLEAARLFRDIRFARTVKIAWFTGEEQGLFGSDAFAAKLDPAQIVGVINLDMFGYDSDDDRCFELHVGTLPASDAVGQCFVDNIQIYNLDLTYDYLTDTATSRSDHGSFWKHNMGAIEVLQDLFSNNQPGGCSANDPNPHYHTTQDVVANIDPTTGFTISKAALATVMSLAGSLK